MVNKVERDKMIHLTGNEKAFIGGLMAFLATTIVQVQQTGQFTLHEFYWSLASWAVTHLTVFVTTNTPKA